MLFRHTTKPQDSMNGSTNVVDWQMTANPSAKEMSDDLDTAIHEILHVLGFSEPVRALRGGGGEREREREREDYNWCPFETPKELWCDACTTFEPEGTEVGDDLNTASHKILQYP